MDSYIYPGPLYAFLPNSNMGDYPLTAERLLARLPEDTVFFGAHRSSAPGAPTLRRPDLEALHEKLTGIEAGTIDGLGSYPAEFTINHRMALLTEPRWLQRWEPTARAP